MNHQPDDAKAIEEQIYRAIRTVKPSFENMPFEPSTRFESLGLQSIELTTVIFEIEDFYGISILDQNLDTFRTVAEARDVVGDLLARKARANQAVADGSRG